MLNDILTLDIFAGTENKRVVWLNRIALLNIDCLNNRKPNKLTFSVETLMVSRIYHRKIGVVRVMQRYNINKMTRLVAYILVLASTALLCGCHLLKAYADSIACYQRTYGMNDNIGNRKSLGLEDHYHQIFYGEWQIVDYIPGGRFSNPDVAINYLGSIVGFYHDKILIDTSLVLQNPSYMCVLIASEDCHRFWKYFYPDDPESVVHANSYYFAYVYVLTPAEALEDGNDLLQYMNGFYIKDNDTLVFNGSFGLLEMSRVSYVDGYHGMIEGV